MKKVRTFTVFALLIVSCALKAAPVSEKQAVKQVRQFLAEKDMHISEKSIHLAYKSLNKSKVEKTNYYVYNIGDDKGFVILSGDNRAVPVLGYSDTGSFDYDKMPNNIKWWLSYYDEAMSQVIQDNLVNHVSASRPTDVISPLVSTKWDQMEPYNNLCPTINGVKCPTGCVATAMAQVINYHRHPTDSTSSIGAYTTNSHHHFMPALEKTCFDWGQMRNTYNSRSSQESIDAVSKLMLYCGQAVNMDYTPTGSGAQTAYLGDILPSIFKYPNTIHHVSRTGYSIAQWDSLLINELKNNRPILYTGYTSSWEGHAFVCDGYNGKGLYHINWGWSGAADGYFRISVLDSDMAGTGGGSTSYRFNMYQSVIIGTMPSGEDDYAPLASSLSVTNRISLEKGWEYTRTDINNNFTPIRGAIELVLMDYANSNVANYGLALCDEDGNQIKTLWTGSSWFYPGNSSVIDFALSRFGAGIENAHYVIKVITGDNRNNMNQFALNADLCYLDVVIDGNLLTITPVPRAEFIVNHLNKRGNNLIVNLTNNDEEYNGYITLSRLNINGSMDVLANEAVSIESNSTRDIPIYIDDRFQFDINKDVYFLSVDFYEGHYFYSNVHNKGTLMEGNIAISNVAVDSTLVIGDRIMCELTLANNGTEEYKHFVSLSLIDEDDNVVSSSRQIMTIQPGEEIKYPTSVPLQDFDKKYSIQLSTYVDNTNTCIANTTLYDAAKGAIYWDAEGNIHTCLSSRKFVVPEEALAINLRNAYETDVVANSNPNTIYMLDKNVPNGLKGKNIVNYTNKGGQIILNDKYDYFVPEEIQATNTAKFIRTFSNEDVGNWSTIMLPFDVDKIVVNNVSVDWIHSENDSGKDIWLQGIQSVDGGFLRTNYTETFKGYTPYLIAITENLSGKTLEFVKEKATIGVTNEMNLVKEIDGYTFFTTTMSKDITSTFAIDSDKFLLRNDSQHIFPFRVYATAESPVSNELIIVGPNIHDGIHELLTCKSSDDAIYSINGVKIGNAKDFNQLPSGIYIYNHTKIIK